MSRPSFFAIFPAPAKFVYCVPLVFAICGRGFEHVHGHRSFSCGNEQYHASANGPYSQVDDRYGQCAPEVDHQYAHRDSRRVPCVPRFFEEKAHVLAETLAIEPTVVETNLNCTKHRYR